jgi:hypothetical protein
MAVKRRVKIRVINRLTLLKNWSDEALNALLPCFIAVNFIWVYAKISVQQREDFRYICESKDDNTFRLVQKYKNFFILPSKSSLHRFLVVHFFLLKLLPGRPGLCESVQRMGERLVWGLMTCGNFAPPTGTQSAWLPRAVHPQQFPAKS